MCNNKWYKYHQITITHQDLVIANHKEAALYPKTSTPIIDLQTMDSEHKFTLPRK